MYEYSLGSEAKTIPEFGVRSRNENTSVATDKSEESRKGEMGQDTARQGSPDHIGELAHRVDLADGNGLTGFVGKSSEISWMHRIYEYLSKSSLVEPRSAQTGFEENVRATEKIAYFVDETELLSVDEDNINPLERPKFDVALILMEAAFCAMNGAFRFLSPEQFLYQLS
jgi:hypothetical protein